MKHAAIFVLCCCWPLCGDTAEVPARDLNQLEVFTEGFPRTLLFRSGVIERWARDGLLETHLAPFNGDTRKYAAEEGTARPQWRQIMADFKRTHSRKLSLIHINGEARTVTKREFHEKYFPGHWIYHPGEMLPNDLAAGDTLIRVKDAREFSRHKFALRRNNETVGEMLPSIILVPVDTHGKKLWYESEFAQITACDTKANTLTVERGQYFSRARTFPAGKTYIATMHCEHWGGIEWTLNMSTECPRDKNGETAADICLREYVQWCGPNGVAAHVDGIGFDVIYFLAKFPGWDINNDGVADDGIAADGRNFQLEGWYAFLKRLRAKMGEDFLLTSDGWEPKKQRAVGTFNGIESEGLCAPNDAWRKIAQTINSHTYWNLHNNAKYQYSYITTKMLHPDDKARQASLYRMGAGIACVLGVSYCGVEAAHRTDGLPMIAEMHRGDANEINWLGQPVGPMVVLPESAPDLLAGIGKLFHADSVQRLTTRNCRLSVSPDGELLVEGAVANPYQPMEITLPSVNVSQGDLWISLEAVAVDPLTGCDRTDRIPRLVTLHAEGLPTYSDQRGRLSFYNDIMGYMGTPGYTPIRGYFRRAGTGRGTIDLTITMENQGACKLRRLSVHNAPLAIGREFEKGVVLVNASEAPVRFDLSQSLPGLKASQLRRIKADPAVYDSSPEAQAMLGYHDGRREDTAGIEVPPLDALFLTKARTE